MLNNLRYKIATSLAKKSAELIKTGDFKSIKKGLEYFKASIMILPPNDELGEYVEKKTERNNKRAREPFKRGSGLNKPFSFCPRYLQAPL